MMKKVKDLTVEELYKHFLEEVRACAWRAKYVVKSKRIEAIEVEADEEKN